jgi:hypothetical protein
MAFVGLTDAFNASVCLMYHMYAGEMREWMFLAHARKAEDVRAKEGVVMTDRLGGYRVDRSYWYRACPVFTRARSSPSCFTYRHGKEKSPTRGRSPRLASLFDGEAHLPRAPAGLAALGFDDPPCAVVETQSTPFSPWSAKEYGLWQPK